MQDFIRSNVVALALSLAVSACSSTYSRADAYPGVDVDERLFVTALAPYGTWYNHSVYGNVWHPRHMRSGWRPYSHGHWAHTSDYGWLWVSDWDWGWAPFHYGRWAFDDRHGWLWIPGRVWAPAWVLWRYGSGYTAWAPIPPAAYWRRRHGLVYDHFRRDRDLPWRHWMAVRDRDFPSRRIGRHLIHDREIPRIMKDTRHEARPTPFGDRIVNHGVPVRQIERETGRRIDPLRVRSREVIGGRRPVLRNGEIEIFRPRLRIDDRVEESRGRSLAERVSRERDVRRRGSESERHGRPERPIDRHFPELDDHDRNIEPQRRERRPFSTPRLPRRQDPVRREFPESQRPRRQLEQPNGFRRPGDVRDEHRDTPPSRLERWQDRVRPAYPRDGRGHGSPVGDGPGRSGSDPRRTLGR